MVQPTPEADAKMNRRTEHETPIGGRSAVSISLGLCLALLGILIFGPAKPPIDSKWTIPTAMSFIRGNGGDISEYVGTTGLEAITTVGNRQYNFFPMGTALVSVPAVSIVALLYPNLLEKEKISYAPTVEKIIASIFATLAAVVFFWVIYDRFRNVAIALLSTLVLMFCTSMWSTATRALWAHGPLVLMVVIAMLLLSRARQRPALAQYVSLPLAMGFIIRPTAVAPIAVLSLYVLLVHRAWFVRYMAWATLIATPWIVFNLWSFGAPLPAYYAPNRLAGGLPIWQGVAVNLVSPARGLLVFSPILLFAISGFVLALRAREDLGLHVAFAAIVVLHLLIVSDFPTWWAGHSYGPRFMTDVLPFLVYFFAFNIRAIVPIDSIRRATASAVIAFFIAASVLIHAQGAYRLGPDRWNVAPSNVDKNPSRIWDWRDLQFTRGIAFLNPE